MFEHLNKLDNVKRSEESADWKRICGASSPPTWTKWRSQSGIRGHRKLTQREVFLLVTRSQLSEISEAAGIHRPTDEKLDESPDNLKSLADWWIQYLSGPGKIGVAGFLADAKKVEGRDLATIVKFEIGKKISERTISRRLSLPNAPSLPKFGRRSLYTRAQVQQIIGWVSLKIYSGRQSD